MGSFAPSHLFVAAVAYLAILFGLAYASARAPALRRLAAHPWTYALGLGVYASSWTYYGSVGFAAKHGLTFLAVYMGATLGCIASPILWARVLRLTREHRLGSVADLLAFRFGGRRVGAAVAAFALLASVPYVAQQIHAVNDSARTILGAPPGPVAGLVITALLSLFAMAFGASGRAPQERHEGLGIVVAFESLVKLAAMLAAGGAALFGVLGGAPGLARFLSEHPAALERLYAPVQQGTGFGAVLVLSFGAAFLLPRQFHMAFAEGTQDRSLRFASIAFPLFLVLLNLGVLPILWAGSLVAPTEAPDTYVLAVPHALGMSTLTVLVFIGGVSAASAMVVVTTIALAGMCVNHLILPARLDVLRRDPYRRVKWLRRALMGAIVLAGYLFDRLQATRGPLVLTGLVSFIAFAQLLPGVLALLYWKRATRTGLLAGLSAGAVVWAGTALAPLFGAPLAGGLGAALGLDPEDAWTAPTIVSLTLNVALLFGVSLWTDQREDEARSAEVCAGRDPVTRPLAPPRTFGELRERLGRALGRDTAEHEIARALAEAGLTAGDAPEAVPTRVAAAVERNLSGVFGPVLARLVLDVRRSSLDDGAAWAEQLRFLEGRLREAPADLSGAAAQLDGLRRYLRAVLEELPIGVCALGPDDAVILWNRALAAITGVVAGRAVGAPLSALPGPWGAALASAEDAPEGAREVEAQVDGAPRVLFVRKATVDRSVLPGAARGSGPFGLVLLVEDRTERLALEAELAHKDRLASIGRLAAGVAHEIGNPLTGIACLAQNLESEGGPPEVRDRAGQILAETRRIDGIVRVLLGYSRSGRDGSVASFRPRVERVDLAKIVDDAVRLVRVDRSAKRAKVQTAVADDLVVAGDAQRLVQVFVNLLTNACDASDEGGLVLVTGEAEGGAAALRVVDHGTGIAREVQKRMFEPFFTTKEPSRGTGLGLSVVHQIVDEHGGSIAVESEEGVGAAILIRLPLAPPPVQSGRTEAR